MGGVDRSDRLVRTYSVSRKSKKWWLRLFYYFLDMSVANSFILYDKSPNHDKLNELDYIKQLSLALIGTFSRDDQVQPSPPKKESKSLQSLVIQVETTGQWRWKPGKITSSVSAKDAPGENHIILVNHVVSIYASMSASSATIPDVDLLISLFLYRLR